MADPAITPAQPKGATGVLVLAATPIGQVADASPRLADELGARPGVPIDLGPRLGGHRQIQAPQPVLDGFDRTPERILVADVAGQPPAAIAGPT